jgi:hypothetical protein
VPKFYRSRNEQEGVLESSHDHENALRKGNRFSPADVGFSNLSLVVFFSPSIEEEPQQLTVT